MNILGTSVGMLELVIVLAVAGLIFIFARKEIASRRAGGHADYKALIVSIGVLGTFIGIFVGLWQFDTADIQGSVPSLLEGLKLAFVTSIMGMTASVFLSGLERSDAGSFSDEGAALASIDQKLSHVETISENTKTTNSELERIAAESHSAHAEFRQFIEEQFSRTNESLEKAVETLAEGATSEIIKALETVIQDFNNNLTEQFGDNFKQLNEAVARLVEWQENYRLQVEASSEQLRAIAESLAISDRTLAAVSDRNDELIQVFSDLEATLTKHFELLEVSGTHISAQKEVLASLTNTMSGFEESLENTAKNVSDLSEGVRESVTAQAKTLRSLTEEIETQLPKTLGELDGNLAGLTQRFASDYQSFLDRYQSLVATNGADRRAG